MLKPTILVTAATGKTGRATTLLLRSRGYPVRALVHRADARSAALAGAGAEVVVGSLEDWVDLERALRGVQRAYFCPPLEPGTLRRAALFAVAAHEAKLEVVVSLSQWLVDPLHLSVHAREKWLSDRILGWVPGVDQVTINPGWFADNYLAALEPIAQLGVMGLPLGQGLNAPPSNEDVGRVIVGALTDPAPRVGKSYRPTGPALLSPEEIAAVFGKVLGRRVKYEDAPMRLFLKAARALPLSDFVIAQLETFLRDYQRNAFGVGAPTDAVEEVGGAPPETFEAIVRRSVGASPLARPGVGRKMTAIWNLIRALAAPAPDLPAIHRGLGYPLVRHASLAVDAATWRATHAPSTSDAAARASTESGP
jgi:uncharacterized protein YbjT (DUF2867 family)